MICLRWRGPAANDARSMRSAVAVLGFAVLAAMAAGCGSTATTVPGSDAGVILPGCRAPSACYKVNCPCTRDAIDGELCRACDPRTSPGLTCDCVALESDCLETVQVCVGRGDRCMGTGARCLPVGSSCMMSGGVPPQVVSTTVGPADAGPSTETRCPYTDDICCTGPEPDLSVPQDLSGTD
jgi:hypothetical protein